MSTEKTLPRVWISQDYFKDGALHQSYFGSASARIQDFKSYEDLAYPEGYFVMMTTEEHTRLLEIARLEALEAAFKVVVEMAYEGEDWSMSNFLGGVKQELNEARAALLEAKEGKT